MKRDIPASAEARRKIMASDRRKCTVCNVFFYLFLALVVAGFLGAVVTVIVFELKDGMPAKLCYLLLAAFLGGGAVSGAVCCLLSRLLSRADLERLDFAERCSSERSFYVGEGTLATFGEDLVLHGDTGEGKRIRIPYSEVRLFSVCTRRAPKEKGEWSVVLELPARYLAKGGKAEQDEKVLVQTDAKERLYRTIEECGLSLLGEEKKPPEKHKFSLKTKYYVPVADKRKKALLLTVIGAVLAAAGIPVAILWNITAGSFLSCIGAFMAIRGLTSFRSAKSVLAVYEEGIYWKDANGERIFLKWEEIESVTRTQVGDTPAVKLQCIYGAYHLPDIAGAYEYLAETHPDKCPPEL